MPDVTSRLRELAAARDAVLERVVTASRDAGVGALMQIGSLGRGGGDAWSDLDLMAVPSPTYRGLDPAALFGERVLATLHKPGDAPIGGSYQGICLGAAGVVLWIDFFVWPAATAVVPADATPIFDDLGVPAGVQDFIPLLTAHSAADPGAPPPGPADTLLRVAVAAKYLARADLERLAAKLPDTAGLPLGEVPAYLHELLAGIHEPQLRPAVDATAQLVDLAYAA
jgi:hypothetical protein